MSVVHHDELDHNAVDAAFGVDFINSHLSTILDGNAVHRSAAGQRAGCTDIILCVVGRVVFLAALSVVACCEAGNYHEQRKNEGKYFCCGFHGKCSPLKMKLISGIGDPVHNNINKFNRLARHMGKAVNIVYMSIN